MEKHPRTIAKTVSWRAIATALTIGGVYWISHDVSLAFSFGVAMNVIKTGAYYIHERMWTNIKWGYL